MALKIGKAIAEAQRLARQGATANGITQTRANTNFSLTANDATTLIALSNKFGNVTVTGNTFAAGDRCTLYNSTPNTITLTTGTGATLYLANNASPPGNIKIGPYAMFDIICVQTTTTSDKYVVVGHGVY